MIEYGGVRSVLRLNAKCNLAKLFICLRRDEPHAYIFITYHANFFLNFGLEAEIPLSWEERRKRVVAYVDRKKQCEDPEVRVFLFIAIYSSSRLTRRYGRQENNRTCRISSSLVTVNRAERRRVKLRTSPWSLYFNSPRDNKQRTCTAIVYLYSRPPRTSKPCYLTSQATSIRRQWGRIEPRSYTYNIHEDKYSPTRIAVALSFATNNGGVHKGNLRMNSHCKGKGKYFITAVGFVIYKPRTRALHLGIQVTTVIRTAWCHNNLYLE